MYFEHYRNTCSNTIENSIDSILKHFCQKYDPDNEGVTDVVRSLQQEGLMDLSNGSWDDDYDILGYLPSCPKCRARMRFNDAADLLFCPECGYAVCGSNYPYEDMPGADEITDACYR